MRQFLALYIFLFVSVNAAFAQSVPCTYSISGHILDEHDNSPLEFASVLILENGISALSDSVGYYVLKDLCEGTYTLKVQHLNCDPVQVKVRVSGHVMRNIFPEHHAVELSGVTVTGDVDDVSGTYVRSKVERSEIRNGNSLGKLLSELPGVNRLNTGPNISKPVIGGMHGNRVVIMNNGVMQEGQQWGDEHAPEVDPYTSGEISVIRGVGSIRYAPDAIGGVVVAEPKRITDSAATNGEVNPGAGTNGRYGFASAFIEQRPAKLKELGWRISGTMKHGGNIHTPDYFLDNTGVRERVFSGLLTYAKRRYSAELHYTRFYTRAGIFSGAHAETISDLMIIMQSDRPSTPDRFSYDFTGPYQQSEHEQAGVKIRRTGENGKLTFTASRQSNSRKEFDLHDGMKGPPEIDLQLVTHDAELSWEHYSVNGFRGSAGLSGAIQANSSAAEFIIPEYRNMKAGVYAVEHWKKNRVELEAGIRFDMRNMFVHADGEHLMLNRAHDWKSVAAVFGFNYNMNKGFVYKLNFGRSWRPPSVNELYSDGVHHGNVSYERGNENLNSELSSSVIMSFSNDAASSLFLDISTYLNNIQDFIYLAPSGQFVVTDHGAWPEYVYENADALMYGFDARLRYRILKDLTASTAFSTVTGYNQTTDDYLPQIPAMRLMAGLKYSFAKREKPGPVTISVNAAHTFEQKQFPEEIFFQKPPSGYTLIGAGVDYQFNVGRKVFEAGISVSNLFNTVYRDYTDRLRYYANAQGRNISINLRMPFGIKHGSDNKD